MEDNFWRAQDATGGSLVGDTVSKDTQDTHSEWDAQRADVGKTQSEQTGQDTLDAQSTPPQIADALGEQSAQYSQTAQDAKRAKAAQDAQIKDAFCDDDKFSIIKATKRLMRAMMVLGLVIAINIIVVSSFYVTQISMHQYDWHIRSAAWAGVTTVNISKVKWWLSTREADDAWYHTNNLMQKMVQDFDLDYVYLCTVDAPDYKHITYIFNPVGPDTKFTPYPLGYEDDYENKQYQENTRKVFEGGETVVRFVGHDKSGPHVTANVPVIDRNGRVVAMLGVRKSMMEFIRMRRTYMLGINLMMVSLLAIFSLLAQVLFKEIVLTPVSVHTVRLRMAMDSAESANHAKSRFLATMSHEIRTPMNAIVGFSELSLRDDAPPATRERLERINRASRALLAIINDILDYSKIEAGRMDLVPADYSLDALLDDVSSIVKIRISAASVKLTIDRDPLVPHYLFGDDARIRQVLINLGGNAAKFTENGEIKISVALNKDSPLGSEGEEVVLDWSVKDTGIGIKEEDISKLFGAFSQVNAEQNRNKEGTGLGLAISRQLVHLMGGEIGVRSTYGKGSEFYFSIPQKVGHEVSKQTKTEDAQQLTCPDAQVLVVDDNEVNLLVAQGYLAPYKCVVITAADGMSAVKIARDVQFDIIFMDQMMPGMDGEQAAYAIRERESITGRHDCIIALTADVSSDAKEVFCKKGFDDYLAKPVDSKEFDRVMREYIPKEKVIMEEKVSTVPNKVASAPDAVSSSATSTTDAAIASSPVASTSIAVTSSPDATVSAVAAPAPHVDPAVLRLFLSQIPKKASVIREYYAGIITPAASEGGTETGVNAPSLKSYQIEVHALKSSAKICAFDEVSALAAAAEKAAKEQDVEYIKENTETLLQKYEALAASAKSEANGVSKEIGSKASAGDSTVDIAEKTDADKGAASEGSVDIDALFSSMRQAAKSGDIVTLEENVARLHNTAAALQAACDEMDTERAAKILQG